jgi:YVTN family beta-propeller protein
VSNYSANNVSVIDTSNNTVVTTIAVGANPWGAAVNQLGSVAYITNRGSSTVSVITTNNNTIAGTIPVGSGPRGVAFAPNGKTAYVANLDSNSVSVVNTGTKAVTATIPVSSPEGIAVTPNGAFVYVTNYSSGSVSVISTLTNKVVATVSVGNSPNSLAISPDGSTVYVPNGGSSTISVIRTADNTVINTLNVEGVWGAAVSPDGHWLYSTDYTAGAGNLVTVIDTSTQTVSTTIVVGQNPLHTSFSEDSAFAYVANGGSANVSVINTASRTVVNTLSVGTFPIGVALMGTIKVTTVAGGYVGDNGPAAGAALSAPYASVQDSAGNLYISDFYGNRIRKVDAVNNITTYAGTGICGYSGEGIKAKKSMICLPNQLLFDSAGNLIVADGSSRIRKISKSGVTTTIVGTGASGYAGDGGPAVQAQIAQAYAMTYGATGNLYFTDVVACVVRKVDTSGIISTVAGNGTFGFSGDGGSATSAQLNEPRGIAVDSSGNVYIGDSQNHRVRKVSANGIITTFAGNGNSGFSGDGGLATSAAIGSPRGLQVLNGVLYIGSGPAVFLGGQARVRMVNLATQVINTYAGSGYGYDGDGHPLLATRFSGPLSLWFDAAGNSIFNDAYNGRVRRATGGIVSTIAGGFIGDGGKATAAAFVLPQALAVDKSGDLYIADEEGNRVRKVSGGIISTIAGTGINGYSGDGGLGTNAMINEPYGVAVDSTGNVFVSDSFNSRVRKVDTSGVISTFATNANFGYLAQMATDSSNNLYVADNGSCVVWKTTPSGVQSIVAGVLFTCDYNGDGISATSADLSFPSGVAVDGTGNLYIADNGNSRLRQVNTAGIISTIAGNGTCGNTGDGGSATAAELCPFSVAVDKSGRLYVSDITFGRVRKISGGIITAFAGVGSGFVGSSSDGLWPLCTTLDEPVAVSVDSKGAVYVLDDIDHRVRKMQ